MDENSSSQNMNELVSLIMMREYDEDNKKAASAASRQYEAGDLNSSANLARMYRDGKGTEVDLDKAVKFMKIAADSGIGWGKREYKLLLNK